MNNAVELIDKFSEDDNTPEVKLGSDIRTSIYFKQGYQTDSIYEDEGFTNQWPSWSDNFDPKLSELDGNHFTFICPHCRAELNHIKLDTTGSRKDPQLNFHLYCQDCRIIGSKKIYLRGKTGEKIDS